MKAGAWAQCQATAAARRATPAQSGHAAGKLCHGRDARRAGGEGSARWTGPRRASWAEAGAGERATGAEAGRAACAAGPKARRRPAKTETFFSISIFNKFSNNSFQLLF